MTRTRLFHLFAILSISIGLIYSSLADNPTFFVAHQTQPVDVFLMIVAVSIIGPLALTLLVAAICWIAGRISARLGSVILDVALFIAASVLALVVWKSALSVDPAWIWAIALVSAVIFVAAYIRYPAVGSVVGFASIGIVVLPVQFLLDSNIRQIYLPATNVADDQMPVDAAQPIAPDTPVIWLTFDEFPLTAILTEDLQIDGALFPNFKRLADTSYWFRNGTTAYMSTLASIPASMSGRKPTELIRIADTNSYPVNLFTLFGPGRRVIAHEPLTKLCPEQMCANETLPTMRRLSGLFSDIRVLASHMVLPDPAVFGISPIGDQWMGFGGEAGNDTSSEGYWTFGRVDHFRRALAEISSSKESPLFFHHLLLPHSPYIFFHNGDYYLSKSVAVRGERDGIWSDNELWAQLGYLRGIHQIGFADRLLGELFDKLNAEGLLERSLIVVTADHGRGYRAGSGTRDFRASAAGSGHHLADIASVPLFIKLPDQIAGRTTDVPMETIDLLPTVLRTLNQTPPDDMRAGLDLNMDSLDFDRPIGRGRQIRNFAFEEFDIPEDVMPFLHEAVDYRTSIFGTPSSWDDVMLTGAVDAGLLNSKVDSFDIEAARALSVRFLQTTMDSYLTTAPEKHADKFFRYSFADARLWQGNSYSVRESEKAIAMSVDGIIRYVSELNRVSDMSYDFSYLIQSNFFNDIDQKVEFYLVGNEGNGRYLVPIIDINYQ
ncbi:sulfatase-like hydrolase/transferase [Aliihoeflea sp. PC F10.4]